MAFLGPVAGPLIGAGAGLLGSAISSNSTKKAAKSAAAAASFKPYSTNNLFGGTSWSPGQAAGRRIEMVNGKPTVVNTPATQGSLSQTLSPFSQGIADSLQGQATTAANSPWAEQGNQIQQTASTDLLGAYGAANGYQTDPNFFSGIMGGYQDLLGRSPDMVGSRGANFRGVNLGGLFNQAQQNGPAQSQMGLGLNLLGNDYQGVANERLGLLRQQAAPQEEQATNALFQRMFNQGRMGSTGGGRDITAFAKGLGEADVSRQLGAQGLAQQLYSQDQGTGANLFSGGVNNFLQGQGLAANIGSNINSTGNQNAQFNASLGLQGQMANQSAGLQGNQQQLAALLAAQGFGQQTDATNYSRVNDRVSRAEGLFGFGGQQASQGNQQIAQIMQLLSGITGQQNDMANLGIAAGGAQASAGANAGRFAMQGSGSPVGSFFQGLGTSYLGSNAGQEALNGLFNFGSSPKASPADMSNYQLPTTIDLSRGP